MHVPISKNTQPPHIQTDTYTPTSVYCLMSSVPDCISRGSGSTRSLTVQLKHSTFDKRGSPSYVNVLLLLGEFFSWPNFMASHERGSRVPLLNSSNGESTRWLTFVFLFLSLCLWPFAWSLPVVIKLVIYSKQCYNAVTTSPLSFHKALASAGGERSEC